MIRKLLMVAGATAMPLGMVAVGAVGAGTAGAHKAPPPASPPITCAIGANVTFAPPGISKNGSVGTAKDSYTHTTTISFTGCSSVPSQPGKTTGSSAALTITSKNSKCGKLPNTNKAGGSQPGCVKGDTYYDTASSFASTGTATLQKAVKKLYITVDGITFKAKTTASSIVAPGAACGSEGGFHLTGTVKAKPYTYTTDSLLACLGTDTGTNTTGNAVADIESALSDPTITVATAQIDPATSQLNIS